MIINGIFIESRFVSNSNYSKLGARIVPRMKIVSLGLFSTNYDQNQSDYSSEFIFQITDWVAADADP